MSETTRDTIADDARTYGAIREESREFGYVGKPLDKNSELYKLVEKQGKELGVDIEKDGIKVVVMSGSKGGASMDFRAKTMSIDKSFLKIDSVLEDPKADANRLASLVGVIKHETQHYKDFKEGHYDHDLVDRILDPVTGKLSTIQKTGECRADLAATGNKGFEELHELNSMMEDGHRSKTHPEGIDRFKALIIKSEIEKETGIALKPNDVKFNDKCEFSITNKDKLHAIPPDVLVKAYEKAEDKARSVKEAGERIKEVLGTMQEIKDGTFVVPSALPSPQVQQEKSTSSVGR